MKTSWSMLDLRTQELTEGSLIHVLLFLATKCLATHDKNHSC